MVSGIRFFACSGALGLLGNIGGTDPTTVDRTDPLLEIFQFEIGANGSPNRMGFFGSAGAPNSAVIVGQYQDTTFRTDDTGSDLGPMIDVKFVGSTTATVSGTFGSNGVLGSVDLTDIPAESGTLLCRFKDPNDTAVITQQATFAAINLTAASGAPDVGDLADNITIQAAQLADTDGDAGDSSWTEVSSGGSALSLADQAAESTVHDFALIVSGSPTVAGRKIDFAYYIQLEFL
jgi:hypothetical protein